MTASHPIYLGRDADSGAPVREPADRPLLVQGPAGCGKTSGVVVPAIRDWPGAVIAVSADEQLWAQTAAGRREAHGPTMVLDLANRIGRRDQPATFDVLAGCEGAEGYGRRSRELAMALVNPFGPRTSGELANAGHLMNGLGIFLHAARSIGLPASMAGMWAARGDWSGASATMSRSGRPDLAALFEEGPRVLAPGDFAWIQYLLAPLADPNMGAWVSGPPFDLRDLVARSGTVYVTSSDNVQGLVNCFLDDVLTGLRGWCATGWRPPHPVLLVLDPIDGLAFPSNLLDLMVRSPEAGVLPLITGTNLLLCQTPLLAGDEAHQRQALQALMTHPRYLIFAGFYAAHPEPVAQQAASRWRDEGLTGRAFIGDGGFKPGRPVRLPDERSGAATGGGAGQVSPDGRWRWDGSRWVPNP